MLPTDAKFVKPVNVGPGEAFLNDYKTLAHFWNSTAVCAIVLWVFLMKVNVFFLMVSCCTAILVFFDL